MNLVKPWVLVPLVNIYKNILKQNIKLYCLYKNVVTLLTLL